MNFVKNKFIAITIVIVLVLVSFQVYSSYKSKNIDVNSYAEVLEGRLSFIKRGDKKIILKQKQKKKIEAGDIIMTRKNTLVLIRWGDGSLTRLGANSELLIKENLISKDLNQIKVGFKLNKGKTWSNIVTIMGEDSYFNEYFEDYEAGVRGTVFALDLDNDYLYVDEHKVEVTNTNTQEVQTLNKGAVFSVSKLEIINKKINEQINSVVDDWKTLNEKMDTEYLEKIKNKLISGLHNISFIDKIKGFLNSNQKIINELNKEIPDFSKINNTLNKSSKEKKEQIYKNILSKYQKLNTISAKDENLFNKKLQLKNLLIGISDKEGDRKSLINSIAYDLDDTINLANKEGIKSIINLINENEKYIGEINKSINGYISLDSINSLINIDGLEDFFKNNISSLKEIFDKENIQKTAEDLGKSLNNLNKEVQGKWNKTLDNLFKINK